MDDIFENYVYHPEYFCPERKLVTGCGFLLGFPKGWSLRTSSEWVHYRPNKYCLPNQGWKIHISSTAEESHETLALAADVCLDMDLPFKHLRTRTSLQSNNAKRAPRAQSGKFITVYPENAEFESVVETLRDALRGRSGPYVLSDVRLWEDAPIYARFGAFVHQTDSAGAPVLIKPDGGTEPDTRVPWFVNHAWAVAPNAVSQAMMRSSAVDADAPFEVDRAISLTNSGGVYGGRWRGQSVIIKEARPHTDFIRGAGYATDRLSREAEALRRSVGEATPVLLWHGRVWEHEYIVTSRVEGTELGSWVAERIDLYTAHERAKYLADAHVVVESLERVVSDLHAAGISHGDLHPGNVLIQKDLSVVILDFEFATSAPERVIRQVAGAPGFRVMGAAPALHIDWFCVRQLAVYLLMRLAVPGELDPQYWRRILENCESMMPAEAQQAWEPLRASIERLEGHVARTAPEPPPNARMAETGALVERLNAGLLNLRGKSPGVSGKKYPTHPYGLSPFGTPEGLAFGDSCMDLVAGVDKVVHEGRGLWSDRLRAAAARGETGLFNGVAGEIFVRALVTDGDASVAEFLDSEWMTLAGQDDQSVNIWSGRGGVILMALTLLDAGMDLGGRLTMAVYNSVQALSREYIRDPHLCISRSRAVRVRSNRPWEQGGGLLYGHLGLAWLFGRAATHYDDVPLRSAAIGAARQELTTYVDHADAGLQRDDNGRRLPYYATGSAGFGTVLTAIGESHLPEDLRAAAERLWVACSPRWTTYPGLFNGHSGLLLGRLGLASVLHRDPPTRQDFARAMEPHLLTGASGVGVAGDAGFRFTCDLASGTAGVLLTQHALKNLWSDPLAGLIDLAGRTHSQTTTGTYGRR